jgi:hypothetical protein
LSDSQEPKKKRNRMIHYPSYHQGNRLDVIPKAMRLCLPVNYWVNSITIE